uniref:Protein kinase domain-containing protein n=1 Tax=Brassica oleracea var. oleracea TaxID=109376 RepID=A0A0D3A3G3_BRAOL
MRAHRSLFLCLFCALATVSLVHGQSQTGYISIDCGAPLKGIERDIVTGISYTSDDDFITAGVNFNVSEEYNYPANPNLPYVLADLKAFPQGNRNCYSLKPSDAKDSLYLIRASFMYGNYDGGVNEKALPEFDLYLNVNFWSTVKFKNASEQVFKEILTYTESEFLYVCLVNKGKGTPFISGLELRPVNSSIYNTEYGRNLLLVLYRRWDIGYLNGTGRYQNDVYDRIWSPYAPLSWSSIKTTGYIDVFQSGYMPPGEVIKTAASPKSEDEPMELSWTSDDTNATFYAYLYFAEFETLETNESRKMKILWNGSPFSEDSFISPFEYSTTLSASRSFTGDHLISLQKTADSTLPPILNAIEIFTAQSLDEFSTAIEEVQAMETIRSTYKVKKVWSGDPCAPRLYPWEGIGCSYNNNNHRIKSLNLSSSGLQGPIGMAFRNLSLLESLNLKGNNFTGVIPKSLMKKFQEGLLALRVDDKNLCTSSSCQEKKKNNMVVPIAVATSVIVLLVVLVIIWITLRQRKRGADAGPGPIPPSGKRRFRDNAGPGPFLLPSGKRRFTYDEVSSITNNFNKVIGKGGFGIVYLGSLEDGTKIAVKMIKDSLSTMPNGTSSSSSSTRASKEFQVEAELLLTVHHRNLASFVGYCDDERSTALIYEYMANGNLQEYLSSEKAEDLSWETRLHIAIDAAQAKIADFGVSKVFPDDDLTHVETAVMGTPGYIDPEYYRTFMLNEKSDVYSFGIVLLELITGQRAIVRTKEGEKISVIHFVEPFLETGELDGVVDPLLHGDYSLDSAWKFVEVAMSCVRERGFNRPAMNQVVSELQQCLAAELAHEPERSSKGNGDREVD